MRPRIVLLRGHSTNPWDLRPHERLLDEYDISVLVTGSNLHRTAELRLPRVRVRTPRDFLPGRRVAGAAAYVLGERYLGLGRRLRGASVVHSAEVGTWFSAQAAALRDLLGYKLAVYVWETLPWREAYRWPRERRYLRTVMPKVDLFVAATERARECLVLEGADRERIELCPPGIDAERFGDRGRGDRGRGHTLLSAGRLVWEKGHQDVIRALAALRQGLVGAPRHDVRLLIVGDGPEGARLRRHANELGVGAAVEVRPSVAYDDMPAIYASASCLVLASLPTRSWEEQFGMVLAEAMAAGTPIVASATGAIPEVVGDEAPLFPPGDWFALAKALGRGPLAGAPGTRRTYDPGRLARFSVEAAGERLRALYSRLATG